MQKIIALDIGSYSVKAIEIVNRFNSYEVTNFYEEAIPFPEEGSDSRVENLVAHSLQILFRENGIEADRVVTAMPGQYISSRILTFNFSERHKIEAAVYGEIEDIVPFQLEDMTIDHQILGTINGRTHTLVVLTKNSFLESFLDTLKHINVDPKIVDIDSLTFYNLCPFLHMEEGKNYGIVDLGHEKTSLVIVQDGVLKMFRSINLGGRYITDFIARDMELPFTKAEELKHKVSLILTKENEKTIDKDTRLVAERITLASKSIARELGRSLYAYKTWEKAPIERLLICGGTSRIQGFDHYLSDQLNVETRSIDLLNSDLNIDSDLTDVSHLMGQGISIGVRAVTSLKRQSQINLRKGPYAYVQDYAAILGTASVVSKTIAFALILLCASYGAKFYFFHKEIAKVQALYIKELRSIPGQSKKRAPNQSLALLHKRAISAVREDINAKKSSYESFVRTNTGSGALVSLEKMSQAVPKDIAIDLVEYKYNTKPDGSGAVSLRIETDSFETVAKFKDALRPIDVFDQIVEKSSDSKPGTNLKIAVLETNYTPK